MRCAHGVVVDRWDVAHDAYVALGVVRGGTLRPVRRARATEFWEGGECGARGWSVVRSPAQSPGLSARGGRAVARLVDVVRSRRWRNTPQSTCRATEGTDRVKLKEFL